MNSLTPAQTERLGKLSEESGEVQAELGKVQQTIGKILIHGYESQYQGTLYHNRGDLEREIGDFLAAVDLMVANGDLNLHNITAARQAKRGKNTKYMHHQNDESV